MSKTFFIADTHFDEDNIRRYENRPFVSVEEMNTALIENWNSVVSSDDEVYILDDFGADKKEADILIRLNGTRYLIKGNHDVYSNEYYRNASFAEVYDMPVLYKGFWILFHDAIYVNSNMPYANLFSHEHNSPIVKDYSSQHFWVSVERSKYTPIEFGVIKNKVKDKVNKSWWGVSKNDDYIR